jgi:hypothetical protein
MPTSLLYRMALIADGPGAAAALAATRPTGPRAPARRTWFGDGPFRCLVL